MGHPVASGGSLRDNHSSDLMSQVVAEGSRAQAGKLADLVKCVVLRHDDDVHAQPVAKAAE